MALLGSEPHPELEGRAVELAELAAAWDDACAGRGRIVVVSGEAGIGKSSLVAGLAGYAGAARPGVGVQPVWGRAWEFADAPAYFPLWPCFAALGLSSAEAQSAPPFALWERVLAALSAQASAAPCLWLLEDLHAADLQTLDLLTFLAQPLRVLRALVVVTTRPRDPRLAERGEQRLLRMARDGLDLRLQPLGPSEVARLARKHGGELSERGLQELLELTSGNPLFVVECARAIKTGGFHAQGGVSPTIRQVVLERLQLLPETTRQLLESGAVLGRDFTAALLGRMHELLPARVVDALLPALRSGVALERGPGSFAFSHVVVQSAVYESLAAEARSELHAKAERALSALPDAPEVLLERARHALGSLRVETEGSALLLAHAACQLLEQSGAFDRAHALYARLRDKVSSGELSQPFSGDELLHMASVAELAGRASEGRGLSLAVLRRARGQGDWQLFARAALELGRALRPGMIDHELVAALRESLAHLEDAGSALGCRLLGRLAAALQPAHDPQGPVDMATEAIERARLLGDPDVLLEVLDVAGSAYVEYAPVELRLESAEALLQKALAARDFVRTQRARARLAFERATLGNFDAYELHVAEMLADADRAGRAPAKIRPLLMASLSACCRGKAAESAGLLAEARQLLSLTDDPGLVLSFRAHGLSRAVQLHLDPELEALEPSLAQLVQGLPEAELTLAILRAMVLARLERREAAERELRAAWPRVGPWLGVFLTVVAEIAAFVRDPEICAACYERLLPLAGTDALGGHVSVSYEGPVDRLLGLLEGALGRHDAAEQKLRSTLALAERRGFDAWIAQGQFDLGNLLANASPSRLPEARAAWKTAAVLAEKCGMVGLLTRAEARLAGVGAAPASLRREPTVPAKLLMVREGELYRLEHGARSARIRASRGAELLARLVDAPHQEIHVLALAADDNAPLTESNAGDTVDRAALRQYRARLVELEELVAEAERRGDAGRAESLGRERSALERELSRGLGLGGRARQAGSSTERARVNVQRRLKDALERVAEASPELGAWLGRSLRTGTYCSFNPTS
jgi:tetratricopeptide (TPR) repeat protein